MRTYLGDEVLDNLLEGFFILSLDISDRKKMIDELTNMIKIRKNMKENDEHLDSILTICTML